jgi:hypothetical protein
MAHSLKTNYLLLALAVVALIASLLGTLAYYERRIDSSDVNQLTATTVGQNLEADLAERAQKLGQRSAPACRHCAREMRPLRARSPSGCCRNRTSNASKYRMQRAGSSTAAERRKPLWARPPPRRYCARTARPTAPKPACCEIWMSRAKLDETLAGLHAKLETHQAIQGKRVSGGLLALITLLLASG